MLTIFSDADFRWSNGLKIRYIRVNRVSFFKFPVGHSFSNGQSPSVWICTSPSSTYGIKLI